MLAEKLRYLGKSRLTTTIGTLFSVGVLLVIISAALAACGTNTGSGGTTTTGTTPTVSTQVQNCGKVQTNPMGHPLNGVTAKQSEECFWQADQKCQPATLVYSAGGLDTVATHTFTVKNNGGQCAITDTMTHQVIPAKPSAAKTYTCSAVKEQADGLHFSSCGDAGDIVVPTILGQ